MTEAPWDKLNVLLLGVTGGIASGKTEVANMLKELGAPIIDFDVIARQVVEPGKPAWQEIFDYFGKQVVQEDGSLDYRACALHALQSGLPGVIEVAKQFIGADEEKIKGAIYSDGFWDIWQALASGIYYNCSECIGACPVGAD